MVFDPRPVSLPLGGLRGWGQKVKIQLFQNIVMLHIILKRIQGSHRLEMYLNLEGFLLKSLKMKSALKSTGN